MADAIFSLLSLLIPFALVLLGYFVGRRNEQRHYESIYAREAALAGLPIIASKEWDLEQTVEDSRMVQSSVVISIDYFKRFASGLRNIFGGEVRSLETLLDRARREAVLRLKESCPDADIIVNLRLDTSSISGAKPDPNNKSVVSVEVIASGTAIRYARNH